MVKPGFLTSEWWGQLVAHVIAALALFHVAASPSTTQAIVGIAAAVGPELGAALYAHSRSNVKVAALTYQAPVIVRPPTPAAPPAPPVPGVPSSA